jgi:hypothetical protein
LGEWRMTQEFDCSLEVKGNLHFPLDITYHGCPHFPGTISANTFQLEIDKRGCLRPNYRIFSV